MKARRLLLGVLLGAAAVAVARSGHELPVYPSYYPHEIEIATMPPERAAALLVEGRLHAYVGTVPRFAVPLPEHIRGVESLGALIMLRVNPASSLARDETSACAVASAVLRAIAATRGGPIVHPYPVTPLHGDYLHHVDLAEAARARLSGDVNAPPIAGLKVKTDRATQDLMTAELRADGVEWDAEIAEVKVADLLAPHAVAINGWKGPPWLRMGWFHASLVLGNATSPTADQVQRLQADDFKSAVERINAERDLIANLTSGCRALVAGYRLRREYFNGEFSAGIENIGFDALGGLGSSIFIRTVKLKDFPWNGSLSLGFDGRPDAAWNPIAGFTDPFGRLLWFAVGDPAALPSPYESAWMLNRISDVALPAKP